MEDQNGPVYIRVRRQEFAKHMEMSSTLREIQSIWVSAASQPAFLAVLAGICALFILIGPFGTIDTLSFWPRAGYWTFSMAGSWLIGLTFVAISLGIFRNTRLHSLFQVALGALLSGPLVALWNWFVIRGSFPEFAAQISLGSMMSIAMPMTLIFSFIAYFVIRPEIIDSDQAQPTPAESLIQSRLPHAKRGDVKYLSMQDHYVNVVTVRGNELVLMRMADAVSDLSGHDGMQVHRSHWVGRKFISDVKSRSGQYAIVMDDGTEVPVSRSFLKKVRAAGYI